MKIYPTTIWLVVGNNAIQQKFKKYTMELIIFSIICGIAGGAIYNSKNRPFINGFLWAFLLGLIGLIVTVAKPTLKE